MPVLRVAASFLLALLAFGACWFGHSVQGQTPQQLTLETSKAELHHIILHISKSDQGHFTAVLDKAEEIMQQYQDPGVQVEVVVNASCSSLSILETLWSTIWTFRKQNSAYRQTILRSALSVVSSCRRIKRLSLVCIASPSLPW